MHSMYVERRNRLAQWAATHGLDRAIVTTPANLRYFTGVPYAPSKRLHALVLDGAGSWRLVLPAMEAGRLADTSLPQLPYGDGGDPFTLMGAFLKGATAIGVEKDSLPLLWAENLTKAVDCTLDALADLSPGASTLRMVKDPGEVRAIQSACAATDAILSRWKDCLLPGASQQELRFQLDAIAASLGITESCPGAMVAVGRNGSMSHGLQDPRTLAPHEAVFVDCGARHEGYYCDITRTFFLGEPPALLGDVYKIVLEAQQAAIRALCPGVPLKDVDVAARRVISRAGYGDNFNHRTGHGLGLEVHEAPQVGPGCEKKALPGMVVTIEPGVYLPGLGGVRIEDDLLVTETGSICLTAYPKDFSNMVIAI